VRDRIGENVAQLEFGLHVSMIVRGKPGQRQRRLLR
jgi:hypothetical protein